MKNGPEKVSSELYYQLHYDRLIPYRLSIDHQCGRHAPEAIWLNVSLSTNQEQADYQHELLPLSVKRPSGDLQTRARSTIPKMSVTEWI